MASSLSAARAAVSATPAASSAVWRAQRVMPSNVTAAACPLRGLDKLSHGLSTIAPSVQIQKVEKRASVSGQAAASPSTGAVSVRARDAVIQFIKGVDELSIPDVRLTQSVDKTSGTATFSFEQPSVFDSSRELGDITGLYMIDEEGTISSVDVSAKFLNGKPARIEARYVMRSTRDWDRFMRFMERYAEKNNLGFVKK